jgi:hypothetical protein
VLRDEASFHLSVYINSRNNRYLCAENSMFTPKCHYMTLESGVLRVQLRLLGPLIFWDYKFTVLHAFWHRFWKTRTIQFVVWSVFFGDRITYVVSMFEIFELCDLYLRSCILATSGIKGFRTDCLHFHQQKFDMPSTRCLWPSFIHSELKASTNCNTLK